MKTRFLPSLTIAATATLFAAFAHAEMPIKAINGVMVDSTGMTLYTFDMDATGSGKSKCNGPCAALWPPLLAAADTKAEGDLTVITRDDGARQVAYKGKPLYFYKADTKAGERTGDNFKDVWHVVKP